MSLLVAISQGPTGKPGLPGMPGADGPPVRTAFYCVLRLFTVVTQHLNLFSFIKNTMQIHWHIALRLTATGSL